MSKVYQSEYVTVFSNVDDISRAAEEQIEQALESVGMAAEAHAVDESTRLIYDTPESPNYRRTRNLRDSITHITNTAEHYVEVGSAVEYAPYVELGTRKMAARPFLKNAIVNFKNEYYALIKAILGQ